MGKIVLYISTEGTTRSFTVLDPRSPIYDHSAWDSKRLPWKKHVISNCSAIKKPTTILINTPVKLRPRKGGVLPLEEAHSLLEMIDRDKGSFLVADAYLEERDREWIQNHTAK